jgi:hypothetical protein
MMFDTANVHCHENSGRECFAHVGGFGDLFYHGFIETQK